MHAANHPITVHLQENVWKVDPDAVTQGRPVWLLWASPDCRHHSKAKGGAPVSRSVRGLVDIETIPEEPARPAAPLAVAAQHLREAEAIGVEKRLTASARAEETARIVASIAGHEPVCIWCDTDYEAEAIRAAIPEAVEVNGKMTPDMKEERLDGFSTGAIRILLTKPSIAGYGLNWQHCNHAIFTGLSFSYESFYQAVRRFYRFGQKRPVNAHVVMADTEAAIYDVVQRKSGDHAAMKTAMSDAMRRAAVSHAQMQSYNPNQKATLPTWVAA